jgi:hypothetical protein
VSDFDVVDVITKLRIWFNKLDNRKFVPEYFTPLTLDLKTGMVSTEDTDQIWEVAKKESMERPVRADSTMTDDRRTGGGKVLNSKGQVMLQRTTSRICGRWWRSNIPPF